MARKVQSQLLVSEVTRARADALALVRGEPRAEVLRLALEGDGLPGMERSNAAMLAAFAEVADRMGMSSLELARKATQDGYTWEDLKDRKRYPRVTVKA